MLMVVVQLVEIKSLEHSLTAVSLRWPLNKERIQPMPLSVSPVSWRGIRAKGALINLPYK